MVHNGYNLDFKIRPKYTLVVRDMIDNDGLYGKTGIFGENANGYNLRQIEDALSNSSSWNDWRNNIKKLT